MEPVAYRLQGLTPLLMTSAAGMVRGGGDGIKKIPTPEDEAASKVYRLDNGQLYLPTVAVMGAILNAAMGRKIGKFTATRIFASSLLVTNDKSPLVHPETDAPITDYQIDVRRAVVQRNGVMRARPIINEWAATVEFERDEDFLGLEAIDEVITIAGKIIGLLDYRPQKRGPFGRFVAERLL